MNTGYSGECTGTPCNAVALCVWSGSVHTGLWLGTRNADHRPLVGSCGSGVHERKLGLSMCWVGLVPTVKFTIFVFIIYWFIYSEAKASVPGAPNKLGE